MQHLRSWPPALCGLSPGQSAPSSGQDKKRRGAAHSSRDESQTTGRTSSWNCLISKLARDRRVGSLTPRLSRRGATTEASRGVLSASRWGWEPTGNEKGQLSHSHMFGLVFFAQQKLLCQLPGKCLCNYCAGSRQVRSSFTRAEGGGREAQGPAPPSGQMQYLAPTLSSPS